MIDFAEDPAFSSRYSLRGNDEAAVRKIFDGSLREQLKVGDPLCVEGEGEWLAIYRSAKRVSPEELGDFVERSRGLAAALDPH